MHAFHQLPERWRTVLWLPAIEGIDLDETAGVLGIDPEGAPDLAARADAGLRTQWQRDRAAAGQDVPAAPGAPQPPAAERPPAAHRTCSTRWRPSGGPSRERRLGPVGLVLPGGRPVAPLGRARPARRHRGTDRGGDHERAGRGPRPRRAPGPRRGAGRGSDRHLERPGRHARTEGAPGLPRRRGRRDRCPIEPMIAAVQAAASARATGDRISGAAEGAATAACPGHDGRHRPAVVVEHHGRAPARDRRRHRPGPGAQPG